jgi:hypothetical protein
MIVYSVQAVVRPVRSQSYTVVRQCRSGPYRTAGSSQLQEIPRAGRPSKNSSGKWKETKRAGLYCLLVHLPAFPP